MTTPSFRGFVEFLEADPTHELNFSDPSACALARYAQHVFNDPRAKGFVYNIYDGDDKAHNVIPANIAFDCNWHMANTYGQAAAMLRPFIVIQHLNSQMAL